jgi:putative methionine-R-sulfoxide reductase with GAF domain
MVPLVLGGRVIGALYVDSPRTGRVVDEVLVALRQLRVSIVKALARQPAAA